MAKKERTRVLRLDGKPINLVRKRCHLLVCAKGCCCGRTDRGHAVVPVEFYKQEYKRRKLRNRIQLSMNGCLGPCVLANVVLLFFDGKPIWFQSINSDGQIVAIYDYIEKMLAAERYLPPPAELTEYVFNYYTWSNPLEAPHAAGRGTPSPAGHPQGILFLTHADTDLLTLHHARASLPADAPPVHALSLNRVAIPEHMIALLEEHGRNARVVVVRLLGGLQSVPGFGRLVELAQEKGRHFLALSGTGEPDPELAALSTVAPAVAQQTAAYLQMGGLANMSQCLRFLCDELLMTGMGYQAPEPQPSHGIYQLRIEDQALSFNPQAAIRNPQFTIGILFYRSHWMSGNLTFIDALIHDLERKGAKVVAVFANSLKERRPQASLPAAFEYFLQDEQPIIDALICTMSFAMGEVNPDGPTLGGWSVEALAALDVPVLQAICCGSARWQWQASARGLNSLDTAMNIALPEFDGRIGTVPISFKEPLRADEASGGRKPPGEPSATDCSPGGLRPPLALLGLDRSEIVHYRPDPERISRVTGLALRFANLRRKPNREKKVAFILTNASSKASRIGNAVGLDAPASLLHILQAMRDVGYEITDLPSDGDALIHALIDRCSYDETYLTEQQLAQAVAHVPVDEYCRWFAELPEVLQRQMTEQWGPPPGPAYVHDGDLALAGLDLGHAFVALQPPRGYGMDPNAIYHCPDMPPPHNYYALYRWLRDVWGADAIVHMGKHGTLEWLPGKSVGLSADCFPDAFLGDLPLFYPFILNDPGEGAQAKRRTHAVIVDHLTPPLTTADAYGELAELMQLVDEYYQVEMLDPVKMPLLQRQIWDLIQKANLQEDLKFLMQEKHGDHVHEWDDALTADGTPIGLAQMRGREISHVVQDLDGYLCELAGAQIRDGLHILGQVPEGEQLIGTLQALTRLPNLQVPSLRQSLAGCFGLDVEVLQKERGSKFVDPGRAGGVSPLSCADFSPGGLRPPFAILAGRAIVTNADALEIIDELGRHLLASLQKYEFDSAAIGQVVAETLLTDVHPAPLSPVLGGEGLGVKGSESLEETWSSCRDDVSSLTPNPSPPSTGERGAVRSTITGGHDDLDAVLRFVCEQLVPTLGQTTDEIGNLLAGLDGRYVPAGPSGAPTRGMAHVLPTGRNFYAVDPRALPSHASWEVGQQLAREVLDRYLRDTGAYPETIGISIWGTSAMRTGGDDVAEVLALLGVRPVWQRENRRVLGIEIISLEELGRPRIDVLIRISGFFRDAFPHLIKLLDEAVLLVSERDEPLEMNFIRKHYLADVLRLAGGPRVSGPLSPVLGGEGRGEGGESESLEKASSACTAAVVPPSPQPSPPEYGGRGGQTAPAENVHRQARYRIFGSKPGCYGAGLLPLIDERNWHSDADLAETYVNWGGYGYGGDGVGVDARPMFRTRLAQVQLAVHNQDNREHDIFDSDDYFQFHGGMIASIRSLSGRRPSHYFGDSHDPAHPKVRDLKEEVLRVFRTRVVNPKWLESIARHGYKGGLELAATVDYLFGYDATAEVIDDWMYEQVAKSYVLDPAIQDFLQQSNPWALHAIGERLLEAVERGMWSEPSPDVLDALRAQLLEAETVLEARGEAVGTGL